MFRANHVSKLGFCMENNQAIEAANLIASLYRGETTLERLPEACRPKSIADAQQILSELPKSLDRPVQGYKCYFPFKATQPNLFAPIFNILPNGSPITRSQEHTSQLQSLMRISYAVFCLKHNTYILTPQ